MTYKDKLSAIGEKLTADKTLRNVFNTIVSNQRERTISQARVNCDEVHFLMENIKRDTDMIIITKKIQSAIRLLDEALLKLNSVQANDEFIETLVGCAMPKENGTK